MANAVPHDAIVLDVIAPFHFVVVGTGTLGRIAQRPHLGCGKAAARYYSAGAMFWLMRKKLSGS
jgi:hypothetical protein